MEKILESLQKFGYSSILNWIFKALISLQKLFCHTWNMAKNCNKLFENEHFLVGDWNAVLFSLLFLTIVIYLFFCKKTFDAFINELNILLAKLKQNLQTLGDKKQKSV